MNNIVIYFDNAAALVDAQEVQSDYPGPLGTNWQWSDMTAAQAEKWVQDHLRRGYSRGHNWNP